MSDPGATLGDTGAAVTIDLSEAPESTGGMLGRIIGGALMFVVFGLVAIACGLLAIGGYFIPGFADWMDLIGDGFLFAGALALGLAITGFELMRRGRKRRRANQADTPQVSLGPSIPAAEPEPTIATPPKSIL